MIGKVLEKDIPRGLEPGEDSSCHIFADLVRSTSVHGLEPHPLYFSCHPQRCGEVGLVHQKSHELLWVERSRFLDLLLLDLGRGYGLDLLVF